MARWTRRRFTFANVMSMIAVFVALGGTGYAAIKIPKNSVGTAQIKTSGVASSEVKNGSLKSGDFKQTDLPKGPTGPQGLPGTKGDKGDPGPITGTLPSGVTLKGDWAVRVSNSIAGQRIQTAFSFGLQLSAAPTPHYIEAGAATPAGCTGNVDAPGADPGNLCVFEKIVNNITAASQDVFGIAGTAGTADPWGAGVGANATNGTAGAPVDTRIRGSWAVTAP
jgi:hypothetical protein